MLGWAVMVRTGSDWQNAAQKRLTLSMAAEMANGFRQQHGDVKVATRRSLGT